MRSVGFDTLCRQSLMGKVRVPTRFDAPVQPMLDGQGKHAVTKWTACPYSAAQSAMAPSQQLKAWWPRLQAGTSAGRPYLCECSASPARHATTAGLGWCGACPCPSKPYAQQLSRASSPSHRSLAWARC